MYEATFKDRKFFGKSTSYGQLLPKKRFELAKKNVTLKNKIMLDIGAGNGAQTTLFLNEVKKCYAVEIEPIRLNEFKKFNEKHNIRNCKLVLVKDELLPFDSNFFDIVTCFETLEHTYNEGKMLDEISRVLKKDGYLIMSVPNKWFLFETHGVKRPYKKYIKQTLVPFLSWLPKQIHSKFASARIYSEKDISTALNNSNLQTKKTSYLMPSLEKIKIPFKNTFRKILNYLERTPLKVFGVSIFIIANKSSLIKKMVQ